MIVVGDIVKTSYNTGPYEVINVYWRENKFYLTLKVAPRNPGDQLSSEQRRARFWLNNIHIEGDRYITANGDEIFVIRANPDPLPVQLRMF